MGISFEEALKLEDEPAAPTPAPTTTPKSSSGISFEEAVMAAPYVPEEKGFGDKAAGFTMETAKGFATGGARLAKTVALAGLGAPAVLADKVISAYTGKTSTKLQDEVFFNQVDPWVDRMQRLAPEEGAGNTFAHTVGDLAYMIVESIISSPAAAIELTAAKGATLLAAPGMKTGMDLVRTTALQGVGAMAIPAVQSKGNWG